MTVKATVKEGFAEGVRIELVLKDGIDGKRNKELKRRLDTNQKHMCNKPKFPFFCLLQL